MSVAQTDIDFAVEPFSGLGPLTTRKMMGGLCIYSEGTIFAIIHGDGLIYLKAKGDLIAEIEDHGGSQWTYSRDGKNTTGMPHWTLPEPAFDDPEVACDWARRALELL